MTEVWRDIPGLEGFYQASSDGRIRSVERVHMQKMRDGSIHPVTYGGKIRATHWNKSNGYLMIALSTPGASRRTYALHALICAAFHGPRPTGMDAAHFDGDRSNNCEGNLRWATRRDNLADKIRHGTHIEGERHGNCKITDQAVVEIRRRVGRGERPSSFASEYGITARSIRRIATGGRRASAGV